MQRRLITSQMRLQAKCEVSCSEYEGIDAIKNALNEGHKASKNDIEVNIKLVAHPLFALTCLCRDKELGINVLTEAMDNIKVSIEKEGGAFELISKPEIKIKEKQEDGDSDAEEKGKKDDVSDSSSSEEDETMGGLTKEQEEALKSTGR